jgi:transcriptional regulator with XRE-family HTH domain
MTTLHVDSPAVPKKGFGDLIHAARAEKNLSLRRLAGLSGVDYSRLARIEQGTRPAPDLTSIRALAGVLDLDVGELLVAAGTSRSVMEDLVWSEHVRLGRALPGLGGYRPGISRLQARNTFAGRVERRCGALCDVRIGGALVRVVSFSPAERLQVVVPPETVRVSSEPPADANGSSCTVLSVRVAKVRAIGQLVNLVLAADGLELNALYAADRGEPLPARGDLVFATLLTAAIHTTPLEEEA